MIAEMMKLTVDLNKPIYIGQAVLELSKLTMFKLRYEELPKYEAQFGGTISVLGGDTDSLICAVSNINLKQLHRQMVEDELLDKSNYPHDHHLFSERLKAVLGCIKDEVVGERILEAVLLKPKAYSLPYSQTRHVQEDSQGHSEVCSGGNYSR